MLTQIELSKPAAIAPTVAQPPVIQQPQHLESVKNWRFWFKGLNNKLFSEDYKVESFHSIGNISELMGRWQDDVWESHEIVKIEQVDEISLTSDFLCFMCSDFYVSLFSADNLWHVEAYELDDNEELTLVNSSSYKSKLAAIRQLNGYVWINLVAVEGFDPDSTNEIVCTNDGQLCLMPEYLTRDNRLIDLPFLDGDDEAPKGDTGCTGYPTDDSKPVQREVILRDTLPTRVWQLFGCTILIY